MLAQEHGKVLRRCRLLVRCVVRGVGRDLRIGPAHGRSLAHPPDPRHQMRAIVVAHAVAVEIAGPRPSRHIGDRIAFSAQIRRVCQPAIERAIGLRRHPPEAAGGIAVALCQRAEMTVIPPRGPHAGRLHEQPLQHDVALGTGRRQKFRPIGFRQIDQDRAGFENRLALGRTIGIDQDRNLGQRVQCEDFGGKLGAAEHGNVMRVISDAHFLKRDQHLADVGAGHAIQRDHPGPKYTRLHLRGSWRPPFRRP